MERQIYRYTILFLITSLVGYLIEVVGCLFVTGQFQERGFLNMPLLPIYGFGSLLIILIAGRKHHSSIKVFLLSIVITTLVEYISGVTLLKVFHQRWWDYSNYTINLNGHIAYWSSIGFGIGGLLVVKLIYPVILRISDRISLLNLRIALNPIVVIIVVRFILTSVSLLKT